MLHLAGHGTVQTHQTLCDVSGHFGKRFLVATSPDHQHSDSHSCQVTHIEVKHRNRCTGTVTESFCEAEQICSGPATRLRI